MIKIRFIFVWGPKILGPNSMPTRHESGADPEATTAIAMVLEIDFGLGNGHVVALCTAAEQCVGVFL